MLVCVYFCSINDSQIEWDYIFSGSPPAQVAPPPTISPSVVNNTCGNELLSSDNITNYVTTPNYPFDYNR